MILTLEAATAAELREKIQDLANTFLGPQNETVVQDQRQMSFDLNEANQQWEPASTTLPSEAPKKRGRKPNPKPEIASPEAPAETQVPEPSSTNAVPQTEVSAGAPVGPLTIDDAKEALKKVNTKFGLGGVRDVLAGFGYEQITKVPSELYGAVIEASNQKVAG